MVQLWHSVTEKPCKVMIGNMKHHLGIVAREKNLGSVSIVKIQITAPTIVHSNHCPYYPHEQTVFFSCGRWRPKSASALVRMYIFLHMGPFVCLLTLNIQLALFQNFFITKQYFIDGFYQIVEGWDDNIKNLNSVRNPLNLKHF